MGRTRILTGICLLILPLAAIGCQKNFTIAFVNDTPEDLQVTLKGPGKIQPSPAAVPIAKRGGEAIFDVKVDVADLPANYEWRAGEHVGSVVLDKHSKKNQIVHVAEKQVDIELRRPPRK